MNKKEKMPQGLFVPLYQQLTEFYRQKIINQEILPGYRIDSISRIMSRHNVSRETAKLVLKKLIKEGLVISKAGKGTFVADYAEVKKIWGMVIPFYSSNMENLIEVLSAEAIKRNRQLIHFLGYNNPLEEMRLVSEMIRDGYEAVIVVPNYDETKTADFYRKLITGNTNVILIDNTMAGSYFKYVIQSYDLGVKRAVEYLVSKTKGNLLLLKNQTWQGRNMLYELFENSFNFIIQTQFADRQSFVTSQISDISKDQITENNITGVLCCVDTDAARILGRLKQWEIEVPGQVSVVSYGNTELTSFFEPAITAIDCQYPEMACKTAELIDKGKNVSPFEQHIIFPKLVERKT